MNFEAVYKKGQDGENFGLPTGIDALDIAMNGVQRKSIYGVAAPPKAGKTTLADFVFVLSPYLHSLENPDVDIEWIYWSFEIDRVRKEFKFACFFLYKDFGISTINLPPGVTHDRRSSIQISPNYLMGKLRDDNNNLIKVSPEIEEKLIEVYKNRIVPLFGKYDLNGNKIQNGKIDFIEERDNPTGLRNYLINWAEKNGTFLRERYETKENGQVVTKLRIVGWQPNKPGKYVVVVTDHMRKLRPEMGYTPKAIVDKWLEYQVELRNWCEFTFVDIIHTNRNLGSVERLKFNAEYIYPTGDDVKETGNMSEDVDFLLTMLNPNDEKYGIKRHFGLDIKDDDGGEIFPNYRSVHLVESRDTEAPQHLQVNMYGNLNVFDKILND